MKSKSIKIICIYCILFIYLWFQLFENYPYEVSSISILDILLTESSGYYYFRNQSTIYSFLFIILLQSRLKKFDIQYIVRVKRKEYVKKVFKINIATAFIFTFIFMGVSNTLICIFQGVKFLIEVDYFKILIIAFIVYSMFYMIVGSIYLLLTILISSKNVSIIGTFIISLILTLLHIQFKIWTPIEEIMIFDSALYGGIDLISVILTIIKFIIIIGFIYKVALEYFKVKDILEYEV